jgi:Domain of unknown function (DUF4263)
MHRGMQTALASLHRHIVQNRLSDRVHVEQDGQYIRLALRLEGRNSWIGYSPGHGYFLVAHPDDTPHVFFDITPETITNLLPISGDNRGGEHNQRTHDGAELLRSIATESPDVKKVEEIIDRASVTDEGLDVLSTVAAIRARRNAISKLTRMMENDATPERSYQELFASEPWMLGAQYRQVVAKERLVWFGARVDLLLASVLGYVDVVELKRPDTRILTQGSRARTWRQTSELADAYSQAEQYLSLIDENRASIEKELDLADASVSRMYRSSVIIVAGRQPEDKRARDAIRGLNSAHPRTVLMTYDEVVSIAEATVKLFERRLVRHVALPGS